MGQRGDDDAALLAAYVAGDADAFVLLYRRRLAAVIQFFMRRTGSAEVSADLTAEVFAAALQSARSYDPASGPVLAWLYGIAGHKLADSHRRGRVEDDARRRVSMRPLPFMDADLDRVEELLSAPVDPGVLDAAMAALPASQREAVIGRVVAERSYAEIAAENELLGAFDPPACQPRAACAPDPNRGNQMKSYFDRLEDELHTAALAQTSVAEAGAQGRYRRWVRAVPLTMAVAVAVLIAGGALLLAHGPGSHAHPRPAALPQRPVGPQPPVAGDQYVAAAFNAAYPGRGCLPGRQTKGTVSQGAPSQTLRNQLPILNRPPTPADQLRENLPQRAEAGGGSGVYVRYIRFVRAYRGMAFYIVPIARVGFPPVPVAVAERCYGAAVHSLRTQLAHVAPGLRRRTLRSGVYEFANYRYNLTHSNVHEGVSIMTFNANGGGGGTGGTPAALIAQRGILGAGGRPGGNVVWYGLVPTGVHTVTLKFAGGRQGSQQLPPISISANVANNLFILTVPHFGPVRSWPATMIWRNASGQIIKTIDERPYHP